MEAKKPSRAICPICKRPVAPAPAAAPYRPFCSQRCRSIDLGSWLSGNYRISRPIEEEDLDEGPGEGVSRQGRDQASDDAHAAEGPAHEGASRDDRRRH